ncbi:MAG: glycosyltransferase family 4 protein [Actinomycetota bacterium]|nr:glycosyltransferase family 4 protein [Actinomycetota bacterium]
MEREEISKDMTGRKRLLLISYDFIGKNMAGPGIRFYELSRILANYCDVTLASPNRIDIETPGFKTVMYEKGNFKNLQRSVDSSDIILMQGHLLYYFPFLRNFKGKIIIDLYNPFNLESLEMYRNESIAERVRIDKNNLNILNMQLSIGDFFICASEKQRDYWVGMLTALGRVNPYNYDDDNSLRKLIDVVPFGIPAYVPEHDKEMIRISFPQIKAEDKIVLWGGGIWNWLDPLTAIKAIWELSRHRNDVKLVFIGIKHPDPKLPEMQKCIEAIKLSKELDLLEKYVFFNEWTPYDLRQNFLLESDLGLSIHQKRIETEFSYRTRTMDYIWARLPIVTTEGDSIAKLVKEENIGEVVKYENAQNLSRIMDSILSNKSLREIYKRNLQKIAPRFSWESVAKPLIRYCTQAEYASDKKKMFEMLNIQNRKMINIIKENTEGITNALFITDNKFRDAQYIDENELGKVFFIEVNEDTKIQKKSLQMQDILGTIKNIVTKRTNFDTVILNNAFEEITPKFFYDFVNIISLRLKHEGVLFLSIPEKKGLSQFIDSKSKSSDDSEGIDDFTIEYILKNTGFEIIEKGAYEKYDDSSKFARNYSELGEIYGKNELFELFDIKFKQDNFRALKLLSKFDILNSDELNTDKTARGKFRKFIYMLTSLYFENMRKSFNEVMKSINNNIHIQINSEINELNRKNRERLILIYFNIFKKLEAEIKNLGYDINELKDMLDKIKKESGQETDIEGKADIIIKDFENIDSILGLRISSRYYMAKKL